MAVFGEVLKVLVRRRWKTLSFCLFCTLFFSVVALFWGLDAGVQQGLRQNLYENVQNRLLLVSGNGPVGEEVWESCRTIPHVKKCLPNPDAWRCQGLGPNEPAGLLALSPYTGEENLRILLGTDLTADGRDGVLLPDTVTVRQADGSVDLDAGQWVGQELTLVLTDDADRVCSRRVQVKGIYSRDQLYYGGKGIFAAPGLWQELAGPDTRSSLLLVADEAARLPEIAEQVRRRTGLDAAILSPEEEDGHYPAAGYASRVLFVCTALLSCFLLCALMGRYVRAAAKEYALYFICGYGYRVLFIRAGWELGCMVFGSLLLSAACTAPVHFLIIPGLLEGLLPNICIRPEPAPLPLPLCTLALCALGALSFYAWRLIRYVKKEKAIQMIRT